MPYVVRHLGATAFGVWMLVNSLVGYMGLLDVGLAPTLIRKSASLLSGDDHSRVHELNRVVSTIFFVYLVLGMVVLATIAAFSLGALKLFNIPANMFQTFQTVLWIAGVQAALAFPMSMLHGLIGGLQDYHVSNALGVVTNLIRAVATVLLLYQGFGLVSLVVMGFAVSVLVWIVLGARIARRIPTLRVRRELVTRGSVRELIPVSGVMILWSFAGYSLHQLDRVIIAAMLPVASLTHYEVGNRLSENSRSILHSWLNTVLPASSAMHSRGKTSQLRNLYLTASKFLFANYGVVALCLIFFGRSFIELWMGAQYKQASIILALLVAGNVVQSTNIVAHVMLVGTGKLRVFARVMAIYPFAVLAAAALLIPRFGLTGMAIALAIAIAAMEIAFLPSILNTFEVSVAEWFRKIILPAVIPCLVTAAVSLLYLRYMLASSWPTLTFGVLISILTFAFAYYRFGLALPERTRAVEVLRGALSSRRIDRRTLLPE